jgi:hypothetical protein
MFQILSYSIEEETTPTRVLLTSIETRINQGTSLQAPGCLKLQMKTYQIDKPQLERWRILPSKMQVTTRCLPIIKDLMTFPTVTK